MVEREMRSAEEARISYVNTMMDTQTRQDQLSQHWFFTCQCSLCSDPKYRYHYLYRVLMKDLIQEQCPEAECQMLQMLHGEACQHSKVDSGRPLL